MTLESFADNTPFCSVVPSIEDKTNKMLTAVDKIDRINNRANCVSTQFLGQTKMMYDLFMSIPQT